MRIAANYFIVIIEKFPILIPTAFVLVGVAGMKVILEIKHLEVGSYRLELLGLHIHEAIFLPLMVAILVGAILYNYRYPEKFPKEK